MKKEQQTFGNMSLFKVKKIHFSLRQTSILYHVIVAYNTGKMDRQNNESKDIEEKKLEKATLTI